MDNRSDYGFIDELNFEQDNQSYQADLLQQEQIPIDQRNSQVTQTTTQSKSKNIAKQFGRALKQYILESFSNEDIQTCQELKNFTNLKNDKQFTMTVLKKFLKTKIGRQVGQIFFGCGKFCQNFIANNKSSLSPNDLFNEIPKYYQKQIFTNNQITIDYDNDFQLNQFDNLQSIQAEENLSIYDYQIVTRIDSQQDEENLHYYE